MIPTFYSARIRLTAWYIVISALISIIFSIVIYTVVTQEIREGFIAAEQRLLFGPLAKNRARILLQEEYVVATKAVLLRLVIMNTAIIGSTGVAGYFLAGKTLQPIEEIVEDQKRFIGDASHELRTPLTTLRSEIEVSLRDKKLPVGAKALLKSNLEEVLKMQNLVTSLLALSRYTDSSELPMERYDLAVVAAEVIKQFSDEAKKENIKINTRLEKSEAVINEASIRQLFSTLIDNAIKYSNKNGKVSVSTKRTRRHVVIKVSDNGVGIPKEDLPYIFNRFYRSDPSRSKASVEGYGLGLAIAKSIVDLHDGVISVSSSLKKGTSFYITLPR